MNATGQYLNINRSKKTARVSSSHHSAAEC